MSFRVLFRLTRLVLALLGVLFVYGFRRMRGRLSPLERAKWLHWACKFVVRQMGIRLVVQGPAPRRGLLVSNHLSYLDIILYGAAVPCVFVSKAEIRNWPLIGLAAACAGTLFIDRSSKASAAETANRMQELLVEDVPVLLFPEGTSTDGTSLLRFHPTLFEPAAVHGIPVTAAAIRYLDGPDHCERDVCYYGDVHFAPSLLQTMSYAEVTAAIRFAEESHVYPDRRSAAQQSWIEVNAFRETGSQPVVDSFHPV